MAALRGKGLIAAGPRSPTPALGGASAQPLRFLNFLIFEPIRSVMLCRNGVAVTVPAPERFAVHKLIVAARRQTDDNGLLKRAKDVRQAALLIEALGLARRQTDQAMVFSEAWKRGPSAAPLGAKPSGAASPIFLVRRRVRYGGSYPKASATSAMISPTSIFATTQVRMPISIAN